MPQGQRPHHTGLLAAVAGWTLLVLAVYFRGEWLLQRLDLPFLKWEYAAQDLVTRQARAAAASPELFFLAIDAPSHKLDQLWDDEIAASPALKLMKRRTWSRDVYAHVLDRLSGAGAKVVAFDLMLPDAGEEGDDARLQAALEEHRATAIIGAAIEETGVTRNLNLPSPTLLPGGEPDDPRIGFVNVWPDEDGVVRRARFQITNLEMANRPAAEGEKVATSLAARMAEKGGAGARVPQDHLPHLFRYAYKDETLLKAQKPPSLFQIFVPTFWEKNYANGTFFRDKIVLIGPEGRFNKDTFRSPFGEVAGAEFHMNAANAILTGEFLRQTTLGGDLGLILLAGILAWVLGRFVQPGWRLGLLVVGGVGWFASAVALHNAGWVVPVLSPIVALVGSGALFSIVEQIFERLEKARLRATFERYVSKDVVKELVDNPAGWLNTVGGQRRPVTVLFSDVRGFTTLTESADPEALVKQLNEYFDDMVAIVFANNGTLDKFIGDAVMAHWGSIRSEGVTTDARRAVSTALQMRQALNIANADWKKRGMLELDIGIGVNHGEVIAANLGSKEKTEFSVISDAVNLASRLEGVTKQYRTGLCIGEQVEQLVREAFIMRSLDLILVKGKTKPVEIFTVLDERASGIADPPWLARHEQAMQQYRAGDFASAETAWTEVLAQCPGDGIAQTFLKRCADLRRTPPTGEWDGVFEMTTK